MTGYDLLDQGDVVFFVASQEEFLDGMCRVVTADDMRDVFDDEIVDFLGP
ncbi:hypothetical protein [Haloterrigena turkmenica]|nr:hypothetical protein [Haloterrigena turkmenica]